MSTDTPLSNFDDSKRATRKVLEEIEGS